MEKKFETIDFRELHDANEWLERAIICNIHDKEQFTALTKDPDFKSSEMRVTIEINGYTITSKTFNEMLNYFTDRMLNQKIRAEGLDNLKTSVTLAASRMVGKNISDMLDRMNSLTEAMRELEEESDRVVRQSYEAVYGGYVNEEMIDEGYKYLEGIPTIRDHLEPQRLRAIARMLYQEMANKRPDPNKMKVKLPQHTPESANFAKQVEECLKELGIPFEPSQLQWR